MTVSEKSNTPQHPTPGRQDERRARLQHNLLLAWFVSVCSPFDVCCVWFVPHNATNRTAQKSRRDPPKNRRTVFCRSVIGGAPHAIPSLFTRDSSSPRPTSTQRRKVHFFSDATAGIPHVFSQRSLRLVIRGNRTAAEGKQYHFSSFNRVFLTVCPCFPFASPPLPSLPPRCPDDLPGSVS